MTHTHAKSSALCVFVFAASAALAVAQTAPQPSPAAEDATAQPTGQNANQKNAPAPVTTPPAGAAPTGAGGENAVIKLSPFEVSSGQDSGYYAPNTLAGTRINSKIEDLGASISVVTQQQLIDTASVDINDIFKYESNTEGIYDYTAFNPTSPTNDSIQASPQTAVRVRGLGVPNMAVNDFVMTSRIPTDTYDLESVEIARGPNSTLFGLGQVSGTVNLNTLTANVTRDFNTISQRVDSYGGWDNRTDFNRVILNDKLALRLATDYADYAYERKPSYDDIRRLYGTVEFRPSSKTHIELIYEHYKENRQTPNFLTARDGVSEWAADGKPVWNPLTYTATVNGQSYVVKNTSSSGNMDNPPGTAGALPAGLYVNTTNFTRPSMYLDAGQMQLWEINRLNASTNPSSVSTSPEVLVTGSGSLYMRGDVNGNVLYQVPGITNKALYDWTKVNAVAPDWNYDNASLYTAIVEQELIPNMWIRGGYHLERSDDYNRSIVNPPVLEVDTNQYLLDGRPNPYFLRPFYQVNEPTIFQTPEVNENLQAQLTYDLNFRDLAHGAKWLRWLGEHRLLGYYEGRHVTDETKRFREAVIDPSAPWNTPGALNYSSTAFDHPTYRYYVGPSGALGYTPGYTPPKSGVRGTFNFNYNNPDGSWVSEPLLFGDATYVGGQTRQEITSRGFATQSFLLDDHLVITTGLRKDFTRSRTSKGAVLDPVSGFYDYGNLNNTWNSWSDAWGLTRTVGAVVKPFHWLGIFGDKSDSFVPQAPAVDLFNNPLPNTYGHGRDIGFYLSFFNDKLVLRASYYKTTIDNDRSGDTTIGTRIARIDSYDAVDVGGSSDRESFQYWAYNAAAVQLTGAPLSSFSSAPPNVVALANSWLQEDPRFLAALQSAASGEAIRGVNDTLGKGAELEIDYNPSYNWTFKVTGAQTKSIQESLEKDLSDYIAERMPIWLSAHDASGDYYWTSTKYSSQSGQAFYTSSVAVPIEIDQALLGKSNPQVKEYSFRGLGKYNFTRGILNRLSAGGSLRWDSKSVIGYLAAAPDADGVVRSLDTNKPVYDPARFSGDMFASYWIPLYGGRFRLNIQLNLNNAFQGFALQKTAINPDGQGYNFRILDPEQFVLTTTLHF